MIRVSERQMQIIDAFFLIASENSGIQQITMSMIADRLKITRQGIYAKHFKSVGEIIDTIHHLVDWEIEEKLRDFINGNERNILDFIGEEILHLIYEKKDWLRVLYDSSVDPTWTNYLQEKYTSLLKSYISRNCKQIELSNDFMCKLIVGRILNLISHWITSENPEPPSLFRDKFSYIVKSSTHNLLEKQQ